MKVNSGKSSVSIIFPSLVSLAVCLAAFGWTCRAQTDAQNTFTWTINLNISYKDGTALRDVKKDEIIVAVDGKRINEFDLEFKPQPAAYVLAIDNSGSLREIFPDLMKSARTIHRRDAENDVVLLMRFVSKDKIQIAEKFSSDPAYLDAKLAMFQVEGGQTALIDAIYKAVQIVAGQSTLGKEYRRAVIVLSDGEDRDSQNSLEALRNLIAQENVQVFFVGLTELLSKDAGFISKSPGQKSREFIEMIAKESGGVALFPKIKNLETDAVKLVTLLNEQYSLILTTPSELQKGSKINISFAPDANRKKAVINYKASIN